MLDMAGEDGGKRDRHVTKYIKRKYINHSRSRDVQDDQSHHDC